MALLIAEGFDDLVTGRARSLLNKRYFNGAFVEDSDLSTSSTGTRYSSGRRTNTTNYEFVRWNLGGEKQEVYYCSQLRRATAAAENIFLTFQDGALSSPQIRFGITGAGDFKVYRGTSTQIGSTVSSTFTIATWYWISIYIKIDSVAGRVVVYLDGNQIFDFTGNTQATENAAISKIYWEQAITSIIDHDDIIIMDPTGSAPYNGHLLVPRRIITLNVTGAGTDGDLAASTGSPFQCVDEIQYNDDTDYIWTSMPHEKSSFVMADLPPAALQVEAVFCSSRHRRDETLPRNARLYMRSGGTAYPDDEDFEIPAAYTARLGKLHLVNPATSAAWTPSEVNGVEAGIELRS